MSAAYGTRKLSQANYYDMLTKLEHVFPKIDFYGIGSARKGLARSGDGTWSPLPTDYPYYDDGDFLVHPRNVADAIYGHGSPMPKMTELKHAFIREMTENLPDVQSFPLSSAVHLVIEGMQFDFTFTHPDVLDIQHVWELLKEGDTEHHVHIQVLRQYVVQAAHTSWKYAPHVGVMEGDTIVASSPRHIQAQISKPDAVLGSFSEARWLVNYLNSHAPAIMATCEETLKGLRKHPINIATLLRQTYGQS